MGPQALAKEQEELMGCQKAPVDPEKVLLYQTLYDGEVSYLDEIFSRIVKRIIKNGLEKNTIVIFLSDHGEGFDHNYNFAHGNVLYNSFIRIPLII